MSTVALGLKKLRFMLLIAGFAITSIAAQADQLTYSTDIGSNGITITTTAGGISVSFGGLHFDNSHPSGDSAIGTALSFSNPSLNFQTANNGVGTATGPTPQFTAGNTSSGILTANLSSIILSDSNNGHFQLSITLTGANFTNCSTLGCTNSGVLASIVNGSDPSGAATGNFDFVFFPGGPQTVSQLLDTTSANSWTNSNPNGLATSVAGNLAPVPEPASLALLGSGLLGVSGFVRRKLLPR
jgi:PEP-CTERM motif